MAISQRRKTTRPVLKFPFSLCLRRNPAAPPLHTHTQSGFALLAEKTEIAHHSPTLRISSPCSGGRRRSPSLSAGLSLSRRKINYTFRTNLCSEDDDPGATQFRAELFRILGRRSGLSPSNDRSDRVSPESVVARFPMNNDYRF